MTYEALKAAWNRACKRAGIENANLHDLRHTSATRFALEFNGNLPVLKLITGHKTDIQLQRYVNIKVDDVVRLMHGRTLDEENAPAGLTGARIEQIFGNTGTDREAPTLPDNVVLFTPKQKTSTRSQCT